MQPSVSSLIQTADMRFKLLLVFSEFWPLCKYNLRYWIALRSVLIMIFLTAPQETHCTQNKQTKYYLPSSVDPKKYLLRSMNRT